MSQSYCHCMIPKTCVAVNCFLLDFCILLCSLGHRSFRLLEIKVKLRGTRLIRKRIRLAGLGVHTITTAAGCCILPDMFSGYFVSFCWWKCPLCSCCCCFLVRFSKKNQPRTLTFVTGIWITCHHTTGIGLTVIKELITPAAIIVYAVTMETDTDLNTLLCCSL